MLTCKSLCRIHLLGNPARAKDHPDSRAIDPEAQRILIELLPFLKSHNDDVFHSGLMDMIKLMIFQLLPAKQSASSNKLQTKLDSLFTESLMKYKGKR